MATMPPRSTRCTAYTPDVSGLFFMPGIESWLVDPDRPSPQGQVEVSGRRGVIYSVGALKQASQHHPEWPAQVREWLQARGGSPDALVVVWE